MPFGICLFLRSAWSAASWSSWDCGGTDMKLWKRIVLIFSLTSVLFQQQVYASPALALAPVFEGVVNRAVGKAIVMNLERRGVMYAANDAVFARTMTYVGNAANDAMWASTAVTTIAAVAGAPVWLTCALGVGAVAAVGAVAWGAYKLTQESATVPGPNGQETPKLMPNGQPEPAALTLSIATATDNPTTPQPVPGAGAIQLYRSPLCNASLSSECAAQPVAGPQFPFWMLSMSSTNQALFVMSGADATQQYQAHVLNTLCKPSNNRNNCRVTWLKPIDYQLEEPQPAPPGWPGPWNPTPRKRWYGIYRFEYDRGGPTQFDGATVYLLPNEAYKPPTSTTGTLEDVVKSLTDDDLKQPVPDALIAQLANRLWQQAAGKPGYDGLPYSATDPITAEDIAKMRAENADIRPTWGDMINSTPSRAPGQPVPISPNPIPLTPPTPTPNPTPDPKPNPEPSSKPDLGPDPGVGVPGLENIPSAAEILRPLLNLFPELRNFRMPNHSGECPKPVFDLFGKSIQMTTHCDLAEENRAAIFSTMSVVWMLVALFIILSA